MNECSIKAYAKINLSIDVTGKRADGYHEVRMIMQEIDLWDLVTVTIEAESQERGTDTLPIRLTVDREDLPGDQTNLAWKAAALILRDKPNVLRALRENHQSITIDIKKNIPMAAGLAGGSADGAAVLHALNRLLELHLTLEELMELGVKLGADVPFCLMGQAAAAPALGFRGASTCAEATGIGECLSPLPPLRSFVLLSKPDVAVSTAEVYGALDLSKIEQRPGTEEIIQSLYSADKRKMYENMYNVLEKVSEFLYPVIVYTKNIMDSNDLESKAMMSGSGPTVFLLSSEKSLLEPIYSRMKAIHRETYLVETIFL